MDSANQLQAADHHTELLADERCHRPDDDDQSNADL